MSLHTHLRVLFPTPHIFRHLIIKVDFFLQKLIHLFLNRILSIQWHEAPCEVHACHDLKVCMWSRVTREHPEFLVEDVLAMASLWNSIINYELGQYLLSCLAVE